MTSGTVSPDAPSNLIPSKADRDELDPELLQLPDPPKRERTLTVAMLLFTAVASIAMIFALRRDAVGVGDGGRTAATTALGAPRLRGRQPPDEGGDERMQNVCRSPATGGI